MRYSYLGRPGTPPSGNRSDFIVPFDVFATTDGAVSIGAPTDRQWKELAEIVGRPDLATDERTVTARGPGPSTASWSTTCSPTGSAPVTMPR